MASQWLTGLANASTNVSNSGRYPRASQESFLPGEVDENRTPPSMRRTANRRSMPSIDASPDRSSNSFRSGNERLYEAYNDLHTLAQDFEKPFDAPAILVVGHQTDGKSGVVLLVVTLTFACTLTCIPAHILSILQMIAGHCFRNAVVLRQHAPFKGATPIRLSAPNHLLTTTHDAAQPWWRH